jgi:hypothetical protein
MRTAVLPVLPSRNLMESSSVGVVSFVGVADNLHVQRAEDVANNTCSA